ncbi:hypothetical protein HXX76_013614 [Chlamydomonas incerta]|uniref:FO synthase n=1 Tax=Chlamydomonas incerta TaxID=51695 RepID=A0A835STG2_CHLIN|nr:hypothetical protein HXX76_013614 [Chlamydomonas incerta]|eukprot:KAG2425571.1 hypothetical protein HXX76_013614 [Chlamydomonas incerta]
MSKRQPSSPGPLGAEAIPPQWLSAPCKVHRLGLKGAGALHSRSPRPAEQRRAATPPVLASAHHPSGSSELAASAPEALLWPAASPPLHDPLQSAMPAMGEVLREYGWMLEAPLEQLMAQAAALRDQRPRHAGIVTFSPKVFLPLTRLCRDRCGYCTFVTQPRPGRRAYMTLEEVLQVAELGAAAGCSEALLTLGDRPELAWPGPAGGELAGMGYGSTLEYVEAAAEAVYRRTGLLPHINAGVMTEAELSRLKRVSASQGLMLESTCLDLLQPGAAHDGCSSKHPTARLATIEAAGRAGVPYTSGLLVGIGDSHADRLHALACLRRLHDNYGHIQELILQNFVAKPGTPMGAAGAPSPPLSELQWAVAAARIMFGPDMNIQAPPNLTPLEGDEGGGGGADAEAALAAGWRALLDAGINDWGGISPITRDFVNPERPWPHLAPLAAATAAAGKLLLPRLPTYPAYLGLLATPAPAGSSSGEVAHAAAARGTGSSSSSAADVSVGPPTAGTEVASGGGGSSSSEWLDFTGGSASIGAAVLRAADSSGLLRASDWVAGQPERAADEVEGAETTHSPHLPPPQPSQAAAAAPSSPDLSTPSPSSTEQHQHQQHPQPQATRPSVPLPRRPGPGGGWRVAVGEDGALLGFPAPPEPSRRVLQLLEGVVERGRPLQREEIEMLLRSRGADHSAVCAAADRLRRRVCGDDVSYVVNRNINYTNVCTYKCSFCAFSKGKAAEALRGPAYVVPLEEISRRAAEAWERGATEVCMQGGIHPDFTGDTYLRILAAAKEGAPRMHVHAFSPLEVAHGAASLGLSLERYLEKLAAAGLGSLPGTAAEVLDDAVRSVLCPDKLSMAEWGQVVGAAHAVGLRTTSTVMFGSVEEGPAAWAAHLVELRRLQQQAERRAAGGGGSSSGRSSGRSRGGVGFSEFVPLPFVHMEAPIYLKGRSRRGATLHEGLLLHAVARLALHPHIPNIQASWVKMGPDRAAQLLAAGCNDMGGSIMNETITRAAGASHGQELPPPRMEQIIRAAGRSPRQRTTLYGVPPAEQTARSFGAAPLAPLVSAAPGSGVLR